MMASDYLIRTTQTSLVYLVIGVVVLGISVGCLLALWFTQGFIYWYFVFGIIVGTGLALYALASLVASRLGPRSRVSPPPPPQVYVEQPVYPGRPRVASAGSHDFSLNGDVAVSTGHIDPNMYVMDARKPTTPSAPPLAYGSPVYLPSAPPLTPPGSTLGAPRFQEQAPAGSPPVYGAPAFQPGGGGDDDVPDEVRKAQAQMEEQKQIAMAAAPVQYGAPPPSNNPSSVREF